MTLEDNMVGTATAYFMKFFECGMDDIPVDWDETGDKDLIPYKEYKMVAEIIACQVSFWCLRRVVMGGGENTDTMGEIIRDKIRVYEEATGKTFQDYNADNKW